VTINAGLATSRARSDSGDDRETGRRFVKGAITSDRVADRAAMHMAGCDSHDDVHRLTPIVEARVVSRAPRVLREELV
jgi:hypothetical protein